MKKLLYKLNLNELNTTTIIAIIALVISIILAIIKIIEFYRDRFRLEAWHNFDYKGDSIYLTNPTRNTILVTNWNLVWIKKRFKITVAKNYIATLYDEELNFIKIDPCYWHQISLNEQNSISWVPKERNMNLWIELFIAGRKILS